MILASLYFVLRAMHVIPFNDVPGHILAILIALIAVGSYYLVREYYTYREKRMEYVLISGLILSAFTTVELLHYHMTNAFWITSFQTGLFCFALVQFWVLLKYLSDRIMKSQQVRWLQQENMKKDAGKCTAGARSDAKSGFRNAESDSATLPVQFLEYNPDSMSDGSDSGPGSDGTFYPVSAGQYGFSESERQYSF